MIHEHGVHHGSFIHHQQTAGQRVVLVAGESVFFGAVFQQTMDGFCLTTAGFRHAFCSAARGSSQQYLGPRIGEHLNDGIENSRLSGARPAGQNHDLGLGGGVNSFTLLRREFNGHA